jgi:hypothetical protein
VTFDLPYLFNGSLAAKFTNPLAQSRRLQTIIIHIKAIDWIYSALKTCPLQAIRVKAGPDADQFTLYSTRQKVEADPILNALVILPEKP